MPGEAWQVREAFPLGGFIAEKAAWGGAVASPVTQGPARVSELCVPLVCGGNPDT